MKTTKLNHNRPKGRIKACSQREADKILRKNGWVYVRSSGRHHTYKHPDHRELITLTGDLNRMLWEKYVRQFNLLNI